ncbi:DNA polymerase III subunit beta [Prevotella sp. P5-92]|uniref:DNA polymerase III subunit beta n=1 Tax=Prevotella sp. P5-92 TaxID=2024222 RepID=UPI000B966CCE|nr:DNA polymerase III subunit beta [Prevotella sp. P5-92]OYP57030.1 DNA polymerase III subunit beta [Prevotella sp. P5-92]
MKFTLSSTALSNKLFALAKVINSKNSLPVLADFVFKTEGNVLFITTSDGENTMSTTLELSECDANDSFAIENHNLLEAVKGFSEQPLTFDVDNNSKNVKIIYQNGQFSLPIDEADNFPKPQTVSDMAPNISLSSALLAENITRSVFATAQDELRPVMNGIYFCISSEGLVVVATDGHKLVRNRIFDIKSEQESSFILPKKPALLLKNMLAKDDSIVSMKFDNANAEVVFGDTRLVCRLIEGRYPNYKSVIPQNNPNTMTIDRDTLLGALKRVQPFANDTSKLVRFRIDSHVLQLDAEDFDFSKTATERMSCEYDGTPMSIGFKGNSFIEVLNNIEESEVALKLSDPSRAGIVVPSVQQENQDLLMLLMPMLLND